MPTPSPDNEFHDRHSDDMQDIITALPSWILQYGIALFFGILVLIIGLSSLIKYPDIVKAQLKIVSLNSPKPITTKISGKLIKLLVKDNEIVDKGQPLAFLESTANHTEILSLAKNLDFLQRNVIQNQYLNDGLIAPLNNSHFGEIQSAYQIFFQEFIAYKASITNGFWKKKKSYLQKDLKLLGDQRQQLAAENAIQKKDFRLATDEYTMHKKLEQERAETKSEFRQEESKYLTKQAALLQTESSITSAVNKYEAKQSEILELDNRVNEEKIKFLQAVNSLISQVDDWKSKYILTSSQQGKISFVGMLQENGTLASNQEIFYVNPGKLSFFGEMQISQNNMGKIKVGQRVLIKLKSYPSEEYGKIPGKITYIADLPYKDSLFLSKVIFEQKNFFNEKKTIILKQGMLADAEIITHDATVLQRILRSILKITDYQ